jgi:hypothetical protein
LSTGAPPAVPPVLGSSVREAAIWTVTAAEHLFGLGSATTDRLRRRLPPLPGLTWSDSYVARDVAHAGPNPWGRMPGTNCLLGLISGFTVGFFAATIATIEIDDHLTSGTTEALLITIAWIALVAVLPAALGWLGNRWDRHDRRRQQRRRDEQANHDLHDDAARCDCLRTRHLTGHKAHLYLTRHLTAASCDAAAAAELRNLHADSALARCPDTGVVWLRLQVDRRRAPHLLRGAPPAGTPSGHPPTRHGTYL